MARVIKRVGRHVCLEEIIAIDDGLYLGSVVECSCGKRFIKRDDPRDPDPYWAAYPEARQN